jgi:hypothetical protein
MSHGLEYLLDEDGDEVTKFEKIKTRPKTMNDAEVRKPRRPRPQKLGYLEDDFDDR